MHPEAFETMREFADSWVPKYFKEGQILEILDVGSMNLGGGCHRDLFTGHVYTGLDIEVGNNVDVVVPNPYEWFELKDKLHDVVISGQAFEHIEFPWLTMGQIRYTLKPGGLCCITVPGAGPEHRYPVDCWRFLPDGMRALGKYVGFDVLDIQVQDDSWRTTRAIYQKPQE